MPNETHIADLMTTPVVTIADSASLVAADRMMVHNRLSCLPVVDRDGKAVGVVSRSDLLRVGRVEAKAMWSERPHLLDLADQQVKEVMTPGLLTAAPTDTVAKVARQMTHKGIHRVFVAQEGDLLGVVSTRDLMRLVRERRIRTPVREVMQNRVLCVSADTPVGTAADNLARGNHHHLAVVDEDGWPIGSFSQREALAARLSAPETPVEEVMSQSLLCIDGKMPLYRAAGQIYALRARRVVVVDESKVIGLLGGLDVARVLTH